MAHAVLEDSNTQTTMSMNRITSTLLLLGSTAALHGQAQTQASNETAVELERFEVSDVPIEQNVLPTSRPFSSVFGTDRSILETPRNVTIISREPALPKSVGGGRLLS